MYKVEKIIDKRPSPKRKGKFEYLVKWEGWDTKDSTWQPEKHLQYVKDLIKQYQQDQNKQVTKESAADSLVNILQLSQSLASFVNSCNTKSKSSIQDQQQKSERQQKDNKKNKDNESSTNSQSRPKLNSQLQKSKVGGNAKGKEAKDKELVGDFKILGMKKEDKEWWFLVIDSKEISYWILHEYLLESHPRKLCQFYESKLVFN